MSYLETYYKEQTDQARQHESQRERMTNIIIVVVGALLGFITVTKLSLWSLPAALTITLLGCYGFCFSGKHYERFRFHTSIAGAIRHEMDRVLMFPTQPPRTLTELRGLGESDHFKKFKWPRFSATRSKPQAEAESWIARQHLHVFWELIHILVALLGISLSIIIICKAGTGNEGESIKVQIVQEKPESPPQKR